MSRADKAILRRMPVLPVDGCNPASTAIGVDRETVERQRASFSQVVHASISTTALHHDYSLFPPKMAARGPECNCDVTCITSIVEIDNIFGAILRACFR